MSGQARTLVGRERERTVLGGLLDEVRSGTGRAAVVLGEAGIGKTVLVEALADEATDQGLATAWGRCTESDAPAFWPWRQALRTLGSRVLEQDGHESRPELFARVVDELADLDPPGLLVIEDIHWADAATLALLRFLVDSVPGLPLLVAATARNDPTEAASHAIDLLEGLPAGVERLPLGGLAPDEVAAVAAQVLGQPPDRRFAERIAQRAGGNPFFVREVIRLQVSRGYAATPTVPAGVRQVLGRRLARLGEACQALLAVAAVAGEIDSAMLAEVSAQPETTVLHTLSEAVTAGLLVSDGSHLRFAHALVRETIETDLAPEERARHHRAIAETLDCRDAVTPQPDLLARRARHWRLAGGEDVRPAAAGAALAAARHARAAGGHEQAVRFYQWALEQPPEDPLLMRIELGESQVLSGMLGEGRDTLLAAARGASQHGRPREQARAVLALGTGVGGFEVEVGDAEQVHLLAEALEGLDAGDDDRLRAAALARLSLVSAFLSSVDERVALADEAIAVAEEIGARRTLVAALAAWCDAHADPDHTEARLARADEMITAATEAGDPPSQLLGRRIRASALAELGRWAAFDEEVEAYERTAARLRLPLFAWCVPMWRAMRAGMNGNIEAATDHLEALDDFVEQTDSTNAWIMALAVRASILSQRGRHQEAVTASAPVTGPDDPYLAPWFAALHAAAGQPGRARRYLQNGLEWLDEPPDAEFISTMQLLARAVIHLDDEEWAPRVLEALRPYRDRWVLGGFGCWCVGTVAFWTGRLAMVLGQFDLAEADLRRALAAHREAGASDLVARAEAALEQLVDRRGRPADPSTTSRTDEGTLRHSGRVWQVTWAGVEVTVPDLKGMRDLAVLLTKEGQDVAAVDLVEAQDGQVAAAAASSGHVGERLDRTARRSYRKRIEELEQEIAEAEAFADAGRLDRLRTEQEWLTRELVGALGLGGRPRRDGEPAERARKAVTMRLRTAIKTIREVHPDLAHHLDRSINTGRWCSYRPEHPTTWQTVAPGT